MSRNPWCDWKNNDNCITSECYFWCPTTIKCCSNCIGSRISEIDISAIKCWTSTGNWGWKHMNKIKSMKNQCLGLDKEVLLRNKCVINTIEVFSHLFHLFNMWSYIFGRIHILEDVYYIQRLIYPTFSEIFSKIITRNYFQ